MADLRVNGNLILLGSNGGTFAFGCQPAGGGFTYLLPTTIPQIGQNLVVASVFNGNTATLQWGTVSNTLITTPVNANTFFSGPATGSAAPPAFRLLAIADLPASGSPSSSTFLRGDGTWSSLTITSVFGRTGVVAAVSGDYTVSQITGAAPLASPTFTGTPNAVTATPLTNNTQLATTGYTDAAVAVEKTRALTAEGLLAPIASPTFTGNAAVVNIAISGTLMDGASSVGTSGQVLTSTVTGVAWADASGGGGTPAGSTGDFQINNAGSFGTFVDINASSLANLASNGLLTIDLANGLSLTASGGFGIALVAAAASLFMQGTLVEINGAFASGDTIIGNSANVLTLHDPNLRDVVSMPDLPVFANNAAALSGGLSVNNLYRTGADPDTICVVH